MKFSNHKKTIHIITFSIHIIFFGLLGWVYFIGIINPSFKLPYGTIYRSIGFGVVPLLYFKFIPTYVNKEYSEIRDSGVIASSISFVISLILLAITLPLQI